MNMYCSPDAYTNHAYVFVSNVHMQRDVLSHDSRVQLEYSNNTYPAGSTAKQ